MSRVQCPNCHKTADMNRRRGWVDARIGDNLVVEVCSIKCRGELEARAKAQAKKDSLLN